MQQAVFSMTPDTWSIAVLALLTFLLSAAVLGGRLLRDCSFFFGSENHALSPSPQTLSPLNLLKLQAGTPGLPAFHKAGSLLFSPSETQVKKK